MKRTLIALAIALLLSLPGYGQTKVSSTNGTPFYSTLHTGSFETILDLTGTGRTTHSIQFIPNNTAPVSTTITVYTSSDGASYASAASSTNVDGATLDVTGTYRYIKIVGEVSPVTATTSLTYLGSASATSTITELIPGTGATNLGKAVDTPTGATDTGVLALGTRDDSLSTLTPIEGDNTQVRLDSTGALWTRDVNSVVDAIEGAAVATSPVPVGCVYRSSPGTLNTGDVGYVYCGTDGRLGTLDTNSAAMLTALQLVDDSQTGDSVHYRTSAGATEDEHEIKATAGRLFSIAVTNTAATVSYVKCFNLTAANTTPASSTVFLALAIPGATTGAGFTHTFGPNGAAFSTALTCIFVKGAADDDVAEVGANEVKAIYSYK